MSSQEDNTAKAAVAHQPEGAGHATRMLAIANELEENGFEVVLNGGGHGEKFVRLNGYSEATVKELNFQESENILDTTREMFNLYRRYQDFVQWIREEKPDVVITDDFMAGLAAKRMGLGFYYVNHNSVELFNHLSVKAATAIVNTLSNYLSEQTFFPKIPDSSLEKPFGAKPVDPIALDINEEPGKTPDYVIVPSKYSKSFEEIERYMKDQDLEFTDVGGEDWQPLKSMLEYYRNVDAVVCTGYSTIMEASVAGTSCIIVPETNEQRGVAEAVEEIKGFMIAENSEEAINHLEKAEEPESADNGAIEIVEYITESE